MQLKHFLLTKGSLARDKLFKPAGVITELSCIGREVEHILHERKTIECFRASEISVQLQDHY